MKTNFNSIDDYIASANENVRETLQKIRVAISEAAPDAKECISYGMPAFRLRKVLVYFAAFKNHYSLFPASTGISAFAEELKPYKHSKGTIQFPFDRPIPFDLIKRIVEFRVKEEIDHQ